MSIDFSWDEDRLRFRDAVIDFARSELGDDAAAGDAAGEPFSPSAWKRCAELGLQGLVVPLEYGGQGGDALTAVLAMEALGYGSADQGLVFSLNAHIWSSVMPILRFGSDEQRRRLLPGLCDGSLIGVQAMTEPGSGSDAFALRTRAVRVDEEFVLDGSKTFITNAPVADLFVVFASTDASLKSFGITAFLVGRGTRGLTVGKPFDKMGLRTSPMAELFFDDCRIPASSVLGRPGNGMTIFNHSIDWERTCIMASALGVMERQIEACIRHATTREQFGRPIADFQAVSHRIVDMKARLESARLVVYKAAWAKDRAGGRPVPLESAMAKLVVSEAWLASSLDALQIHGATGYMREAGLERDVRDAVAGRIYSGTSEIQKSIIAKAIGL